MRPRPSSEPDNDESRTSSQSCPIAMREQDPDQAEMAIPHLFRCPISLDVFTDPVTLCTGQTYDRSNIERWLQLGNLTCPVTMQRLQDPSIVPNHTLRHLIEHWNSLGRRPIDPDLELVALKHDLESHETTSLEDRHRLVHMVQKVRDLSDESPSRCARLIRLGFLPLLLELVFGGAELRRFSHRLVEEALACAIKLLDAAAAEPESSGSLSILREDSMLRSFYELFEEGGHSDFVVKSSLCRIIEVICSSPETRDISTLLVKRTSFLHELIVLLYQNDEVSEAGLRAIKSLCLVETNRDALVQTGLLDCLIGHIRESTGGSSSTHLLAMAILEQTLVVKEARGALLDHPNGIKSLVKMVFQVSDLEGSDSAVSCLILLCENSLRAREAAIGSGVLTQLLLLLQSHCSVRTKARARVLLKLLRSKEG